MPDRGSKLTGKTAIVTGGGRGVGFGIARALADEGASVLITGRTAETLTRAADDIREATGARIETLAAVSGVRADADRTIAFAVERFGQLDILVNNAQSTFSGIPLDKATDAQIEETLGSGLMGTIHHMQAAFPHLRTRGGSIVNIGSNAGAVGRAGMAVYGAAKEGIRGLSRSAARDWGAHGIRVNVVSPASLTDSAKKFAADFPEEADALIAGIPLGRLGDPLEDIGRAVAFLASADAQYITGQTISINGGQIVS